LPKHDPNLVLHAEKHTKYVGVEARTHAGQAYSTFAKPLAGLLRSPG
jgi:hypothetical protein